jgi:hypothetical protein
MRELPPGKSPLKGQHGDKPGRYQPAARILRPLIDPGDALELEVFITGYGEITLAKLVFYPSPNIFTEASEVWNLGILDGAKFTTTGRKPQKVTSHGSVISFEGGMGTTEWGRTTTFFDISKGSPPMISTEASLPDAPIVYRMITRKDVNPGTYQLQFLLSYFNGSDWNVSSQQVNFTIRNILQRHELLIAGIAVIAAIVTFIPGFADSASTLAETFAWWRSLFR